MDWPATDLMESPHFWKSPEQKKNVLGNYFNFVQVVIITASFNIAVRILGFTITYLYSLYYTKYTSILSTTKYNVINC